MYKICSICSRNFDIILKFENLVLETQQFLKYMNWDHIIPPSVKIKIKNLRPFYGVWRGGGRVGSTYHTFIAIGPEFCTTCR